MLLQTCTNSLFVIVVMTTITKEHFMKCVACLCGPNVATNLLQTGFAPFTFSPNGWIPYLGPFIGRVLCIIYTRTDWYNKQGKRFALDIGLLGSCLSLTPSLIFHTCTSILAVCSSLSFQLFSIHVLAL